MKYELDQKPTGDGSKIDRTTDGDVDRRVERVAFLDGLSAVVGRVQLGVPAKDVLSDPVATNNNSDIVSSKEVAAKALLDNFNLVVSIVTSSKKYNDGLNGDIRRTMVATRAKFGSISDYDDAFQDACEVFLRKYGRLDATKGTLGNYMSIRMNQAIARAVGNTTSHVRYPIHAQNKAEPLVFMPGESIPDSIGMGYDDASDGYLERWLPLDEVGLTPKHDVTYDNSGDDDYIGSKSEQELDVAYNAVRKLPERTRRILLTYYEHDDGEGKRVTLDKVAIILQLDLKHERVQQIITQAMKSIHESLAIHKEEQETVAVQNKARLELLAKQKYDAGGTILVGAGAYQRHVMRSSTRNQLSKEQLKQLQEHINIKAAKKASR